MPRSAKLNNACFFIISGHGGPDPGATERVGNRTLHEDEYAYGCIRAIEIHVDSRNKGKRIDVFSTIPKTITLANLPQP